MEHELTPLEQLRKVNAELAAQNRKNAGLLKGPLHTISNLVRAATARKRKIYEKDKNGNIVCVGSVNTGARAIRNIIEGSN
jgi:chemotaxis response regulator CheB